MSFERRRRKEDGDGFPFSTTLLIDNYDSYSNILAHVVAEASSSTSSTSSFRLPLTVRNDAISVEDVIFLVFEAKIIDRIILSPGPGTPSDATDSGVVRQLLRSKKLRRVPTFGVCFGFQAMAHEHGWEVRRARHPKHGEVSKVVIGSSGGLFEDVPSAFEATRYHSLEAIPGKRKEGGGEEEEEELVALAWADIVDVESEDERTSGTVMALKHKVYPRYGVQFHPESICTEPHGKTIVKNFMDIADAYWKEKRGSIEEEEEGDEEEEATTTSTTPISEERKKTLMDLVNAWRLTKNKKSIESGNKKQKKSKYKLRAREIDVLNSPARSEDVFRALFSDAKNAFWLDSATADGGSGDGDNDTPRGRFSIMGCRGGSLWRRVESRMNGELVVMNNRGEIVEKKEGMNSILEYMNEELNKFNVSEENFTASCISEEDGEKGLPEALLFACGFVGSLSYETREECDSPIFFANDSDDGKNSGMVKAALYFVDRAVVIDHEKKKVYVMTLTEDVPNVCAEDSVSDALVWLSSTTSQISESVKNEAKRAADETSKTADPVVANNCTQLAASIGFKWRDSKEEYVEKIKKSQERILDGHTYEVCLTNALTRRDVKEYEKNRQLYLELYYALRERNPAPYAAFFDFSHGAGEEKAHFSDMYLCCASPERFLRCDQSGNLEAKPIKGTIARVEPLGCPKDVEAAHDLQTSVKDNAENLMIVDLLRNDLSLACMVGTVKVPGLLKIESYRTVHQLVSTVVGTLPSSFSGENGADDDEDTNNKATPSPLRAFQFAFPPGSMTGAPKYRTTQIIHELENEQPREAYSGSVGFWSCRNRAFDANVVIRSVMYKDGEMKIGAGGAITRLSDPLEEWKEVELKARRIVETVAEVERKFRVNTRERDRE